MKVFKTATVISGVVAAALIGFAGPASASTPIAHTPCERGEAMQKSWDVNTGAPLICVSTGASGPKWVPDATR
ncbi:hypothetical protein [Nocardia inohanensis]|uniref:hypothetical protein n=1 Tax=Nocardia inohanensis TaxID=209246 RepID=UPI00082E53F8|nr:hypothetical protein [Nocardia inohanensis]